MRRIPKYIKWFIIAYLTGFLLSFGMAIMMLFISDTFANVAGGDTVEIIKQFILPSSIKCAASVWWVVVVMIVLDRIGETKLKNLKSIKEHFGIDYPNEL